MNEIQSPKKYDLEERTYCFARNCRALVKKMSRTIASIEDGKQLVRSSGSIAANYIEANEALSKKDFLMRIKISRKEAKESQLWLRLLESTDSGIERDRKDLEQEAYEIRKIFGAILVRSQ